MKLICTVQIGNRLLPTLAISGKQKPTKATLALCKNPKSDDYCIILFTNQNKSGTKYGLKKNISQILTRFIKDGKATIQFKVPPHDLYIQSDVIQLKGFLHLLKRVLEDKILPTELSYSSFSVTPFTAKDIAPKKLVIRARSQYPLKGFPRTLESLYINGIKRCSLDLGILRLIKLKILDLSDNCIEFIPTDLSILHLVELNLSSNHLYKSNPKQWNWMSGNLSKSLNSLNLEANDLIFLTDQIVKLRNLVTLNVNKNKISKLPNGIGRLQYLKSLSISTNNISSLPGSLQNSQIQHLNLSDNHLLQQCTQKPPTFPKTVQVGSLKEISARRVLDLRLLYSAELIPYTLVEYLDNAKYCICKKACFKSYIAVPAVVPISHIAQEFVCTMTTSSLVTLDCYFCSMKCLKSYRYIRNRQPII